MRARGQCVWQGWTKPSLSPRRPHSSVGYLPRPSPEPHRVKHHCAAWGAVHPWGVTKPSPVLGKVAVAGVSGEEVAGGVWGGVASKGQGVVWGRCGAGGEGGGG